MAKRFKCKWSKGDRVSNVLGEVGIIEKIIDMSTVKIRYESGRSGIAYGDVIAEADRISNYGYPDIGTL